MAWRGTGGSNPAMRVAPEVYRRELAAARELGLPVTVHASGPRSAAGQIAALAAAGLLGRDLQVVHANCASADEIAALAEAGCAVSVSPYSELLIGYGLPRTAEFRAAGIPVGLSVDTTALTGNADMFAIMKVTQALVNAAAEDEFALTARQALALGTIEGARSLGLAGETGSLTPGKRADVIMVECAGPNLGVFTDPAQLLVTAAQPANVHTVLADGQVLKRDGAAHRPRYGPGQRWCAGGAGRGAGPGRFRRGARPGPASMIRQAAASTAADSWTDVVSPRRVASRPTAAVTSPLPR